MHRNNLRIFKSVIIKINELNKKKIFVSKKLIAFLYASTVLTFKNVIFKNQFYRGFQCHLPGGGCNGEYKLIKLMCSDPLEYT